MRFLTRPDCAPIFLGSHLYISDTGHLDKRTQIPLNLQRVAGGPADTQRLGLFAEHLIRWLPSYGGRLLFLDSWATTMGSPFEALRAIRAGLGEGRDVQSVPGHYFGPHSWTWDPTEMSKEQESDGQLLIGMLILTMNGIWDGWLVAENCGDIVEFWEGNVLFYSSSRKKIEEAKEILAAFECRTNLI